LEDAGERFLVERLECNGDRKAADELGDEAEAEEIIWLDFGERILGLRRRTRLVELVEADLPPAGARLDDLLEPIERAATDEQDVLGVDLDVFLLRVLASALRRNGSDGALENLEQRLLDAFARDVASNAWILRLSGNLVDLVDVDDAALAFGDIEVTGLEQADEDVLHVFADVAGFGERGRVGDRERNVENAGQGLGEQRLADAGRADEQDVRLVELDVVIAQRGRIDALVVVVDGHRQRLLGLFLPDHVLVQRLLDLLRRWDLGDRFRDLALLVLGEDLIAERDTLVADVDRGPGDELTDRVLGLPAERAT